MKNTVLEIVLTIIPLIVTAITILLWYLKGYDEKLKTKGYLYHPPKGLNSLEVGYIYKGEVKEKDINSLLLYLASKKYLKIVEIKNSFSIIKLKDYNGKDKDLKEPNLLEYLDLVALATICDVMPLVGINRAFVINGIKTMRRRKNFGIDALISQNKTSDVTSDTIAFSFGPKINAAGRLASADLSVQLLSTKNPIEAKKIAQQLDDFNKERQALERKIIKEAIQQIDEDANFICAYSKKWHVGIVGIVAGRLKETYHKPSLVIAIDENGQGRGSCRSIPQVDISVIINKAIQKGIVASGGGHSMAAGFCIEEDKIPAFIEFLQNEIKYEKSCEELSADCYLAADMAISLETTKEISAIGPFGNGNKHPKFVIPNLIIAQARIVGKNHIRLRLSELKKGVSLDAILFRSAGTTLGNILLNHKDPIQVLGTLSVSEWNGKKSICFILEDVAKG